MVCGGALLMPPYELAETSCASFASRKTDSCPSPVEANNGLSRIKCGALLGQLDDLSASFPVPNSHECCNEPDRVIDPFTLIPFH
jgi:hypothetical protein